MLREIELKRGLKDVYIDKTMVSFIDGQVGKLLYRGYNIRDLAEKSSFEETTYLLLYGTLPTRRELEEFDATLRSNRSLPKEVVQIIRLVHKAHPMDVLRTAVSAMAAFDPETRDNSLEATRRKGIRLTAQAPTIVAAHSRIRQGLEPISPNPKLNHAANFLHMLFGKEPPDDETEIIDKDFVLHAEHGINASAFGARVAASTASDFHSAVVAGIGILKGPAHGGAAEEVMKMALDIGEEDRSKEYARKILDSGGRIMGFGHRVYKTVDPRSIHLREEVQALGEKKGQPKWFRILSKVEEVMRPYAGRGIFVNVDFFSGTIYHLLDIPQDLFVSIFAMGRIPGWTVQVMEQYSDNILLRPMLEYVGPMDLEYVPIDQRG
ncbi:MAG: citrate (Si)-synthase [Chloroflexi bacterium]|nr:citrate (Si)-synthase [Chloroflexota bacterium]